MTVSSTLVSVPLLDRLLLMFFFICFSCRFLIPSCVGSFFSEALLAAVGEFDLFRV